MIFNLYFFFLAGWGLTEAVPPTTPYYPNCPKKSVGLVVPNTLLKVRLLLHEDYFILMKIFNDCLTCMDFTKELEYGIATEL